jgi:lipoprotein-releasing system permease protein
VLSSRFEFFVALRYLKAKRKQAMISLITGISVLGVAAGVMAMVIALAINAGFRNTLQRNLLGATAHVTILEKAPSGGVEKWRELIGEMMKMPHVVAATPSLYGQVFLSGPVLSEGAVLKGIDLDSSAARADMLLHLKQGSVNQVRDAAGRPGLILGARLAERTGMQMGNLVTVISPQGEMTPYGPRPAYYSFRVAGIFESGFFDLDSTFAFTSLRAAQRVFSLDDVVNAVELKVDDIYLAPDVARAVEQAAGPKLAATHWMEQNRQLLNALRMEKAVTVVTIGLIQLVAALNILITLVMMGMEKYRDIAILMSMGARREQIQRIFLLHGVLIGAVGTVIGLVSGYTLSYLADRYRWISLDAEIYSLSFVPFEPRLLDGLWIAAVALVVSLVATLYPARSATRISPVEALRYE